MTQCKLCGDERDLQESHIIPRFLYKYMLKVTDGNITQFDGRINLWQNSNRQLKKKLLCFDCEQLLSKNETQFSDVFKQVNAADDKSQFVYAELDSEALDKFVSLGYGKADIENMLKANPLQEKLSILEYFSISYIYRELLNNSYTIPSSEVEKIKRYLLKKDALPFMLNIRVHDSKPSFNFFTTAIVMDTLDDWKHFVFYIPNMQFHIALRVKGTPDEMVKTLIIPSDFKKDEIGSINLLRKFQEGSRVANNLN